MVYILIFMRYRKNAFHLIRSYYTVKCGKNPQSLRFFHAGSKCENVGLG